MQLVQRAQGGDRAAFGHLVERYQGRIYAAAMAITADPDEARELAQETFVRALQSLPRLQDPERFQPWLRQITHTLGMDLRRKLARERRHLKAAADARPTQEDPPEGALAERETGARDTAALRREVAALPETCRVALDLRYREGLSYAQIAEALGVPASTVRGLLHRGTKTLRQRLKPLLVDQPGSDS